MVSASKGDPAKMLRLLGLGARGGLVVVGVELTRKAVGAGKVKLAVVAADVSEHSKDKIVPLLVSMQSWHAAFVLRVRTFGGRV
jgi:ribosomal protein L7Ae-like RNA K-turn-binding protein